MSCPTPSDFQNLVVDANSAACDQLRKLGLLAELVADAYECIYNEDGSLSQTFIDKLCDTGCSSGTTSSTTTGAGGSGEQLYTAAGSYTFTVPGGITLMTITAVGGGGGGGGRGSPSLPACTVPQGVLVCSGGGAGEKRTGSFAVTPGDVLTIVVGSGGGQDGITGAGYAGNQSYVQDGSLTTIVLANGGGGGARGCCNLGPYAGGAGGTGGSGGTGTAGSAGGSASSPSCTNGSGGSSPALGAGAGSAGNPADSTHPGSAGAVRLTW